MSEWGPVFVATVLFVLLTPGLLIQIPGQLRFIEFGSFQTSRASILVHSILYVALICIFMATIGVPISADCSPVLIGVVLFVLLQPNLLIKATGEGEQAEGEQAEFGRMNTNVKAIVFHALIFFACESILLLALHIHIYTG